MIQSQNDWLSETDALVDEVRAIRAGICAEFGDDVDRLADHLAEVEREWRDGSGRFAGLLTITNAEVVASWGPEALRDDDPLVDEIRAIRRNPAEPSLGRDG